MADGLGEFAQRRGGRGLRCVDMMGGHGYGARGTFGLLPAASLEGEECERMLGEVTSLSMKARGWLHVRQTRLEPLECRLL